jgi:hypothetical protein
MVATVVLARETDVVDEQTDYYISTCKLSTSIRENVTEELDSLSIEVTQAIDLQAKHFDAVKFGLEAATRLKRWNDLQALFEVSHYTLRAPPLTFQECWRYNTNKQWQTLADLAFTINDEIQKAGLISEHRNGM